MFFSFILIRIPTTLVSKEQNLPQNLHKFQATLKYQSVAFLNSIEYLSSQ